MNTIAQHIEALLFTAGEAVSFQDLVNLLHVPESEIISAAQEVSRELSEHGISVVLTDTHAQLVTSESVSDLLAQFTEEGGQELSKAAMETLSVIAYRGPITRYDVDAIRGVDSRRMIRQLLLRGLLRQIRTAGKASLYDISEEALMKLGITKKEDLPDFASLSQEESLSKLLDQNK